MSALHRSLLETKHEHFPSFNSYKLTYHIISNFSFITRQRSYKYYKKSFSFNHTYRADRNKRLGYYALAIAIGGFGAAYGSVPLYKFFCQRSGFGGTTQRYMVKDDTKPALSSSTHVWTDEEASKRLSSIRPVRNAPLITVNFQATTDDTLPWTFVPTHPNIKIVPGETALSFFTATNHSNNPITGVATYNVMPSRAGLYFQKIQCFCFEEQRLLPGESVDMPVFFYIDPDYLKDTQLNGVYDLTLSYFFFHASDNDDD